MSSRAENLRNCLAVIPARGGSKGIPRKNILPLAGKPLLAWNIEAAQAARTVGRVVVSTDDPEIAEITRRYGAEVIHRPADISGDTATSESALLHALDHLKETEGYEPDLLVFLQCTSPLTTAEDIDGTVEALHRDAAETALAVTPFHYFVWQPSGDTNDAGGAMGVNHDKRVRLRRQDREPQYLETGAVYVMTVPGFRETRHRFFGKTAMYVMPGERVAEIDEPADFAIAEARLRERGTAERAAMLPETLEAVVFDFDGVFTDNRVTVLEDGREAVVCSRGDGMGVSLVRRELGISLLVLSTEVNPVVTARCRKLRLEVIQDCGEDRKEKAGALRAWLESRKIDPANVVYVGNDVNDLECLRLVGCPVVVADAHVEVIGAAKIVLENRGGHGAVRELCDLVRGRFGGSSAPNQRTAVAGAKEDRKEHG